MTAIVTLLAALALGQGGDQGDAKPIVDGFKPDPSWKKLGQDLWFDAKESRLVIRGRVALQDGALEHLLCRKGTKEHESVLATDAPAKGIMAGLLLVGAEKGEPVRFEPRFQPPTGSAIAIEVEYEKAGKKIKADAREWVKDPATGAALARDWVFAGSELFEDPRTKTMIFAADDGDLFTVANFPAAILDLPFRSSASDADRSYVANPEKVPVRGTPVTMYLKPRTKPARPKP